MSTTQYRWEFFRAFFVKRKWLGGNPLARVSKAEIELLHQREDVNWSSEHVVYLEGFIAGWKAARD